MSWSWRVARVRGIDIRIHATFWLILLWIGGAAWLQTGRVVDVASGVLLILVLFGIVVLHELAHSFTALRFGGRVRDITLLPIGGVSRLERIPQVPIQEFLIAIAGPAVNVVLALVFGAALFLFGDVPWPGSVSYVPGGLLVQLVAINVVLAVFNLLPAFPMDGGRVLRSLLALKLSYADATRIAARIGQATAVAFFVVGILFNPFLMLIAVFVWIGAAQEAASAQAQAVLGGIPVREAMTTQFQTLASDDPLQRAVELAQSGFQEDFPVVDAGRVTGLLTKTRLLDALARGKVAGSVAEEMSNDPETIAPDAYLDLALDRLRETDATALPVVREGELVGLLTRNGLTAFLALRSAMQRSGSRPDAGRGREAPQPGAGTARLRT